MFYNHKIKKALHGCGLFRVGQRGGVMSYYPRSFRRSKKNKYNAHSVEYDGIQFDSQREALRFKELAYLLNDGIITNLKRQVKYVLIPAQREPATVGKRGGIKQGKVIEQECSYIADFVYEDNGNIIVEVDGKLIEYSSAEISLTKTYK